MSYFREVSAIGAQRYNQMISGWLERNDGHGET
jgi:hypothetical protein